MSDTGSGMSPATLARAFEPFFTTKGPGRGSGLGLSNVWNIARRAGGTVDVASTEGAGTCFSVYLPVDAAAARPVDAPPAAAAHPARLPDEPRPA